VTDSVFAKIDGTKLLVDLQQVNSIVKNLSGCIEPEEIARIVTDGLVQKFDCVFARIWLMEPDRTTLKLVASAGLYQRIDGFFARVPVGAFKVGKIAQNQIPFLSNQLAAETWVLDRNWAITHGIQGFAGYPLVVNGESIGVLAVFNQQPMAPEFLEVLQSLCAATSIGLAASLLYQQQKTACSSPVITVSSLSEKMAKIVKPTQLTLVGTERLLPLPLQNLFLRAAEVLSHFPGIHNRLTYFDAENQDQLSLEVVIAGNLANPAITTAFAAIQLEAICLGGTLEIQPYADRNLLQVLLTVTSAHRNSDKKVNLRCSSPVLQIAFSHLVDLAGLTIAPIPDPSLLLLTDDRSLVATTPNLLWIDIDSNIPHQARGKVDLSTTPQELRSAINAIISGEYEQLAPQSELVQLSEREREIMNLLAKGCRDRDIAGQLIISESTVKFHINNILAKFKAKTRFQALYQVLTKGLI
jgi:DNA-binding CsgD family transcriptional regulator